MQTTSPEFTIGSTHYEFIVTGDGSPSICMSSDCYRPEAMHHRQGALAESLYIYHGVLMEALAIGASPKILSVGLGCAYNELITVAHFIKNNLSFESFYLESFEGDTTLRLAFNNWLADRHNHELQLFDSTYEHVLQLIAQAFAIEANTLKAQLRTLQQSEKFTIRDWLTSETEFNTSFGVIMFDAFSNKSTPQLWSDVFLIEFLKKCAAPTCGFATYAATGALNRALKQASFELLDQRGFAGKRESTRALRRAVLG